MNATKTDRKISPKQREYLLSLLDQREVPMETSDLLYKCLRISEDPEEFGMSMADASAMIDDLKMRPKKQPRYENARPAAPPTNVEPKAGMYRRDNGEIVRVYLGQQSGFMLLKRLVEDEHSEHGWAYEYVGRASYKLGNATPLPLEEAQKFGRMTGTCCVCARRLDVPESVEAGIGPVCAKRFS